MSLRGTRRNTFLKPFTDPYRGKLMSLKQWLVDNEATKKQKEYLLNLQKEESEARALEMFKTEVRLTMENSLKSSLAESSPYFTIVYCSEELKESQLEQVVLSYLKDYLKSEEIEYSLTSSKIKCHPPSCDDGNPRRAYYALTVEGKLELNPSIKRSHATEKS